MLCKNEIGRLIEISIRPYSADEIAPISGGLIDDEFRQDLEIRVTIIGYEIGRLDNPPVGMTHSDECFSTLEG